MTGRTHDLAAFTALNIAFIFYPLQEMSLATLVVALAANFIGGLFPDLDNSTTSLWQNMRGGKIIAKILSPLMGGHRLISHSLLGLVIISWLLQKGLAAISSIFIVDMTIVQFAFIIGMVSHLITDSLTKEGIPLLFPLPVRIGFPPFKVLRLKTGGLLETSFVFPGLMLLNGYFIYTHAQRYLDFFQVYLHS